MLSATILDKNGTEVPTSSPDGGAVMELTLDSSNPALQTFYLAPEPGSAALVFGAFALAGLWYGRSRKAA